MTRQVGRASLVATIVVAALLATPAPRAEALSCAEFEPYEAADVVFDGVALSGPRIRPFAPLASPARIHVVRYLKGHGPRVVRVGNGTGQLFTGDDSDQLQIPFFDWFQVAPGHEVRIYADTPPGARSSAEQGVIWPAGCTGSFNHGRGRLLRAERGRVVAAVDDRGRPWRARRLRANGPLRCLAIELGFPRVREREDSCVRVRRADALITTHFASASATGTSAIAAAAPGLAQLEVASPDGAIAAKGVVRRGVGIVLLPGRVEAGDVRIEATFGDGRVIVRDPTAASALAPDPSGGPPWVVASEAPHPGPRKGMICATYRQRAPGLGMTTVLGRFGACGRAGSHSRFFAIRRVRRFAAGEEQGGPADHRTVVFGVAGATVARVTVTGPDGEHEAARAARGGAFAVVLPAGTSSTQVTITFHLADGSVRSYRGIRQANLLDPPESDLEGFFGRL